MRKSLAGVIALLTVVLSSVTLSSPADATPACSAVGSGGDWSSFGHDFANTRTQPAELGIGAANVGRLVEAWTFVPTEGGKTAALNSTPTEAGGCVYIGTSAGFVYALSIADGSVQWKTHMPVTTGGLGGDIVGSITVTGGRAYVLVNEAADGSPSAGPYAAALDAHSGALVWRSAPLETHAGSYTNADPVVHGGLVIAGWSPAESDPTGTGGVDLIDASSGALVKKVYTIPLARQAQGFAGGGIWTNPAVDSAGFAYAGTGNPYSKTKEDVNTNAIIKIDLRRSSLTFGEIVGAMKGNIDQYSSTLQFLANQPICAQTASLFDTTFFDDPVCGQLDLDFGASPNLFTVLGKQYVGDLQKAGVYHVADTATMKQKWAQIVGTPCVFCNADATAVAGGRIFGEGTLGGFAFSLSQATGALGWYTPVVDAIHYQSFSYANGVVYTVDSLGFLDAFSATSGLPLARRPLVADAGKVVVSLSSTGVSIARHRLFVGVGSLVEPGTPLPEDGYLVAFKTP